LPNVVVYESIDVVVYEPSLNIVLNTAPNSTGIDQEVEVTQSSGIVTISQ
jgi:hypothetical protein